MKVLILGWMFLALLWHLPNIIIGLFTSPLQAIAGLIVIGIMISSVIHFVSSFPFCCIHFQGSPSRGFPLDIFNYSRLPRKVKNFF